jgi:hypothetical protein
MDDALRTRSTAPRAPLLRVLVLLAGVLAAPGTWAQSEWYAIEMIVFAHPGGDARFAESWRADPGMPDRSRAQPVVAGGAVAPVSPSAYRLSGIWQALRASAGYRPLRHLAWTQRGASQRSAPEILVGEQPDAPVQGVVQVSRARFLHVKADLLYLDADGSYRFTVRRRMRSNELHYMDHPMFGLLVIATRLEQ